MKQSSITWITKALQELVLTEEQVSQTVGLCIQAEEMHKSEILDAFVDGYEYREMCETRPNKFSSTKPFDYYNETFKDIPLK